MRDGSGYCERHQSLSTNWLPDKIRGNRHARGYGREWEKIRPRIIARDKGLCQPCLEVGRITPFKAIDHIVAKEIGGTDDDANLQCICGLCHREKTAVERGGKKVWRPSP